MRHLHRVVPGRQQPAGDQNIKGAPRRLIAGRGHLRQRHPAAHRQPRLAGVGEPDQDAPRGLLLGRCQPGVRRIGEPGQRAGNPARRQIASVGEDAAAAALPGIQQRRGQQRQATGAATHILDDRIEEIGLDLQSRIPGRPLDRPPHLVVAHRPDQDRAVRDAGCQLLVLGARSQVVRADRQDHPRRCRTRLKEAEKLGDKARPLALVAACGEQLLELVDHHDHGRARGRSLPAVEHRRKLTPGRRARR